MYDEGFKDPEIPTSGTSSFFQPGHVHPIPQSSSSSSTVFSRFVQKVGLIFNRTQQESPELKLNGRISELQKMADDVLFELLDFKQTVKEKVNPDLFALVITIIDPLIKEAGRTPPVLEKKDSTAHQVKLFSRYVDTIEKAKSWIEIDHSNENFEQALIQQIAKEFLSRIDRDIQVIQDYLSHSLDTLEMSETFKEVLKAGVMSDLLVKLDALENLKSVPSDFCLNSFISWRSQSDENREELFEESLHIIDEYFNEYVPSPKNEKDDHLHAIEEQLKDFETRINKLSFDIDSVGEMDESQRKIHLATLEKLEIDIHQLNSNLHLTHEHGERLEMFLETLLALKEDFPYN